MIYDPYNLCDLDLIGYKVHRVGKYQSKTKRFDDRNNG